MYFNLHTLPANQHMYTLYVTTDPEGTPRSEMSAEEIDIVAPSRATWREVGAAAGAEVLDLCGPDARLVGVVDQSVGYVMYDAFEAGDEG